MLNFLYFYGFEFGYINYGISLNEKNLGKTYKKFYNYKEESTISVESIVEKGKDIGIKCFKYYKIVELFQNIYFKIKKERKNNILSILKSLGFPVINYE